MNMARMLAPVFLVLLTACSGKESPQTPLLSWYVFAEPSGAFAEAARLCSHASAGRYRIEMVPLPADADQQREQLARRLAARDPAIDIIGMDVIWTAEFAQAGWVLPWDEAQATQIRAGRLASAVASATYHERLWAVPYTTNTQLLWYREDRIENPPATWDDMLRMAQDLGELGTIQAQGERYEGLTVFFVSMLASAGGRVLDERGERVSLAKEPTLRALRMMKKFALSQASDPALSAAREDQGRLAFEAGDSSFMVNYTYVWPSARHNVPELAQHLHWARWPALIAGVPSRVTLGGINLGVAAYGRHPHRAYEAVTCLAGEEQQRLAAKRGGLPPTLEDLYDDVEVRAVFPFAEVLRATLRDAVQRPQSPVYSDISLAITRILHPLHEIDPEADLPRLRAAVQRALRSEGLL